MGFVGEVPEREDEGGGIVFFRLGLATREAAEVRAERSVSPPCRVGSQWWKWVEAVHNALTMSSRPRGDWQSVETKMPPKRQCRPSGSLARRSPQCASSRAGHVPTLGSWAAINTAPYCVGSPTPMPMPILRTCVYGLFSTEIPIPHLHLHLYGVPIPILRPRCTVLSMCHVARVCSVWPRQSNVTVGYPSGETNGGKRVRLRCVVFHYGYCFSKSSLDTCQG